MHDPRTLSQGETLALTADPDLRLYGCTDGRRATAHPLDLTGELYQTWLVLRSLENALASHPLSDRHDDERDRLAELHSRAAGVVNNAQRAMHDLWAQQTPTTTGDTP